MTKDNWIQYVLNSTEHVHEADVNPLLYQNIINSIHAPKQSTSLRLSYVTKWAVAASVCIALNVFAFIHCSTHQHRQHENAAINEISNSMNTGTTYSY